MNKHRISQEDKSASRKRRKDLCNGPPDLAAHAMLYSASLDADTAEFQENSHRAYSCVSPFTLSLADSLATNVPRREKIEHTFYNDNRVLSRRVIVTF